MPSGKFKFYTTVSWRFFLLFVCLYLLGTRVYNVNLTRRAMITMNDFSILLFAKHNKIKIQYSLFRALSSTISEKLEFRQSSVYPLWFDYWYLITPPPPHTLTHALTFKYASTDPTCKNPPFLLILKIFAFFSSYFFFITQQSNLSKRNLITWNINYLIHSRIIYILHKDRHLLVYISRSKKLTLIRLLINAK